MIPDQLHDIRILGRNVLQPPREYYHIIALLMYLHPLSIILVLRHAFSAELSENLLGRCEPLREHGPYRPADCDLDLLQALDPAHSGDLGDVSYVRCQVVCSLEELPPLLAAAVEYRERVEYSHVSDPEPHLACNYPEYVLRLLGLS